MAITRQYVIPPRVQAMLDFWGGFGQQRQRVKEIEAGQEAQANRQLEQSVGQGISDFGQSIFRAAAVRAQQEGALQRQQARSQAYQQAQQMRDQADAYQQASRIYQTQHGITPEAVLGRTQAEGGQISPESMPSPIALTQPQQAGPAAGMRLPFIDPSAAPEYAAARKELMKVRTALATKLEDPHLPMEEATAIREAVTPYLRRLTEITKKYPPPQKPRTFQEMAQAGVHNGGVTMLPDGSGFLYPSGPGKISYGQFPKGKTDALAPVDWSTQQVESYARSRMGDQGYDNVIKSGGVVKVQPDGTVDPEWPSGGGGKDGFQDRWDEAKKQLEEERKNTATVEELAKPVPGEAIGKRILENMKAQAEARDVVENDTVKMETDALHIRWRQGEDVSQEAREILNDLITRYPRGSQVPSELQPWIDSLGKMLRREPPPIVRTPVNPSELPELQRRKMNLQRR